MDLKETQAPLKARYREDAEAALITLTARASEQEGPTSCSIYIGRAIYEAQAHAGTGGAGTAACSGDFASSRSRIVVSGLPNAISAVSTVLNIGLETIEPNGIAF